MQFLGTVSRPVRGQNIGSEAQGYVPVSILREITVEFWGNWGSTENERIQRRIEKGIHASRLVRSELAQGHLVVVADCLVFGNYSLQILIFNYP